MDTVTITTEQFNALPEYSCSVPTGTTLGKRWKCKRDYYGGSKGWRMGEYGEPFDDPRGKRFCKRVPIIWSNIEIKDVLEGDTFLDEIGNSTGMERHLKVVKFASNLLAKNHDAGDKAQKVKMKKYPITKTELTQEQVDAVKEFLSSEFVEHMRCIGSPNSFDGLLLTAMGGSSREQHLERMLVDARDDNRCLRAALGHATSALASLCNREIGEG